MENEVRKLLTETSPTKKFSNAFTEQKKVAPPCVTWRMGILLSRVLTKKVITTMKRAKKKKAARR